MKKIKWVIIISFTINIVGIICGIYIIEKRGGFLSTIRSMGGKNYIYEQRLQVYNSMNVSGKIVFLGDSLTDYNEWSEFLERDDVVNRGISGDTTANLLNRLDGILKDQPSKIFIMIGVNDLLQKTPVTEVFENYSKIIQRIKNKSPQTKIYLQETLRVDNAKAINRISNKDVEDLNKSLRTIEDVTIINMDNLSENGQLKGEYSLDGVHLTPSGYMKWKENIAQYLN